MMVKSGNLVGSSPVAVKKGNGRDAGLTLLFGLLTAVEPYNQLLRHKKYKRKDE